MKKKWVVAVKGADFNKIAADHSISPYLARIIRNRGLTSDEQISGYLGCDLAKMHDPALLNDMENAASILADAIEAQVPIRIVGDYDIDGICASYILKKGITSAGGVADVRLPERIRDGYGINAGMIDQAYDDGIELIVTCDNGIAAAEETAHAAELGMSVIVTDHHEVPYELDDGKKRYILPPADAVIDPKRPDSTYPFCEICGAMVCYKLISYLYANDSVGEMVSDKEALLNELLSFAAFATVGDIMPLIDENRIAVKRGLELLKNTPNAGMRALIEVKGLSGQDISAYHVGFILGPCVNASGRLETADAALELFECTDPGMALEAAKRLSDVNASRKNMTEAFAGKAFEMVRRDHADDRVIVVYIPECHESLAGIVAGRLKEEFYRPSIVLTDDMQHNIKGSGRSIEGYDMYEELSAVSDLFTKFGGHKMAAGLSMPAGSADKLRLALNDNCKLTQDDLTQKMMIDIPLPVGYVNEAFVEELEKLEPYGVQNPKPLFAQKDVPIRSITLSPKKNCLRMNLEGKDLAGNIVVVSAVLFDGAEEAYELLNGKSSVSILYQAGFNTYNGRRSVQLLVKDYF